MERREKMIEERFPFTNTDCPTFSSVAGGMCRCKRQQVENASTNIFTWCTEQDGMALIVETFFFFLFFSLARSSAFVNRETRMHSWPREFFVYNLLFPTEAFFWVEK